MYSIVSVNGKFRRYRQPLGRGGELGHLHYQGAIPLGHVRGATAIGCQDRRVSGVDALPIHDLN